MAIGLSLKVDSIYIESDGHAKFDNDSYPFRQYKPYSSRLHLLEINDSRSNAYISLKIADKSLDYRLTYEPRYENRSSGFPTWSDTNRAEQPLKMARGLKFRI